MTAVTKKVDPFYMSHPDKFSLLATITQKGKSNIKGKDVFWVRFDRTIFHPQGGGQPSDKGTISYDKVESRVDMVSKAIISGPADFDIDHFFSQEVPFEIGQKILLKVEEQPRRLHARLHSGGHLIADLLHKLYPQLTAVQGHHFPGEARVVFNIVNNVALPELKKLQEQLQKELDTAIESRTPAKIVHEKDGETVIRKMKIGEFAGVPCGGTHLKNMADLGSIKIRSVNNKKGQIFVSYDIADILAKSEGDMKEGKADNKSH